MAPFRRPAPTDAPFNPYRGIPLAGRSAMVAEGLAALDAGAHGDDEHWDTDHLRRCWATHLAVPTWDGPAMWLHGDLHPLNIIVRDGRVAAIIDLGDLTSGDPATDLFVAWALLPVEHRPAFRAAAAVDDHTWARGRGWALCMGLAYVVNQSGDAELRALGQRMLREVLSDPEAAD